MDFPAFSRAGTRTSSFGTLLLLFVAGPALAQRPPPRPTPPPAPAPERAAQTLPPPSEFVRGNLSRRSSTLQQRPPVRQVLSDRRYTEAQNLLPSRAAVPYTPFARVNPATGQALNPNAVITLPNGRRATVREFFDHLDGAEQHLAQRGYSMRSRAAFAGVRMNRAAGGGARPAGRPERSSTDRTAPTPAGRPAPIVVPRGTATQATPGGRAQTGGRPPPIARPGRPSELDQREAAMNRAMASPGIRPGPATPFNTAPPHAPPGATTLLEGNNVTGYASGEAAHFAIWTGAIQVTGASIHAFRFNPVTPTQRSVWQVSTQPFPAEAPASYTNWQNPVGLVKSGVAPPCGANVCFFFLNFSEIAGGTPEAEPRYYYVRLLPVWSSNETVLVGMPSSQVEVRYGAAVPQPPIVLSDLRVQSNSAPLRYAFPEGEGHDFQVWIEAQPLNVRTGTLDGVPAGIVGSGGLMIKGRSFNPASLVDGSQPRTLEYSLVGVDFSLQAGLDVNAGPAFGSTSPVAPQTSLRLLAAGLPYELINQTGSVGQPMMFDCATLMWTYNPEAGARVWFGPIPIDMRVGARVDYGISCKGEVSSQPADVLFYAQPFVSARVYANAGTDLVIAWAKLEAELTLADERILLEIDTQRPGGSFSARHELSNALGGRMYFTAGFYHPCAPAEQIEKIWGYLVDDEPMPLCSTSFEETLLDSPGYSTSGDLY